MGSESILRVVRVFFFWVKKLERRHSREEKRNEREERRNEREERRNEREEKRNEREEKRNKREEKRNEREERRNEREERRSSPFIISYSLCFCLSIIICYAFFCSQKVCLYFKKFVLTNVIFIP